MVNRLLTSPWQPLFLLGFGLRLVLILVMLPTPVMEWYAPFLERSTAGLTLDPWSTWLEGGGSPAAFPYGYAMWLAFLPGTVLAKLVGMPVHFAYSLTILCADLVLCRLLQRLIEGRGTLVVVAYWLSPVVIVASYALGYNDLIPAVLLVGALYLLRSTRMFGAGVTLVAAVSAKLSMVVAAPFFLIYLYRNRALRQRYQHFVIGCVVAGVVLGVPFIRSPAAVRMLVSNPEIAKIYSLSISFGNGFDVNIVPLVYILLLYTAWRIGRPNFTIFQATMGMAFWAVVLLTPAAPGWFLWCVPFLCFYQALSDRTAMLLVFGFGVMYVLSTLVVTPLHFAYGGGFDVASLLPQGSAATRVSSLLHTMMVAVGLILAVRLRRESIGQSSYYRQSRKPFVIAIAGDSGVGKDTYVNALANLFGEHSVVRLSGDDYHLWDRQKPMWQVMTHLNPMANDLEAYSRDLVALVNGKAVNLRHYDHARGKMTRRIHVRSNDFILVSGLHALYQPLVRDCCDLKVFLDIDEGLRRYFKIARDVGQRGHDREKVIASMERRRPDGERFIKPQAQHADLVFSLQPVDAAMLDEDRQGMPLRLKLEVRTRLAFNERTLSRTLVGLCGLRVDLHASAETRELRMVIEGDVSAADIAVAAAIVCPEIRDFLDIGPQWQDGTLGLMQLITLSHVSYALTRHTLT